MLFIYPVDVFWCTFKCNCKDDVPPTITHILQSTSPVIMFVFWIHYRRQTTNDSEIKEHHMICQIPDKWLIVELFCYCSRYQFHRWMKTQRVCSVSICGVAIINVQICTSPLPSSHQDGMLLLLFPNFWRDATRFAVDWYAAAVWGRLEEPSLGSTGCWT
jgi:hypothetical protein